MIALVDSRRLAHAVAGFVPARLLPGLMSRPEVRRLVAEVEEQEVGHRRALQARLDELRRQRDREAAQAAAVLRTALDRHRKAAAAAADAAAALAQAEAAALGAGHRATVAEAAILRELREAADPRLDLVQHHLEGAMQACRHAADPIAAADLMQAIRGAIADLDRLRCEPLTSAAVTVQLHRLLEDLAALDRTRDRNVAGALGDARAAAGEVHP